MRDSAYPLVQTRNEFGEILMFESLEDAFAHAKDDASVWKISFTVFETGERVRLVTRDHGFTWIYQSIVDEVLKGLIEMDSE